MEMSAPLLAAIVESLTDHPGQWVLQGVSETSHSMPTTSFAPPAPGAVGGSMTTGTVTTVTKTFQLRNEIKDVTLVVTSTETTGQDRDLDVYWGSFNFTTSDATLAGILDDMASDALPDAESALIAALD